ncbi:hypothetical protein ACOMHN_048676 [Nucella lapillus]
MTGSFSTRGQRENVVDDLVNVKDGGGGVFFNSFVTLPYSEGVNPGSSEGAAPSRRGDVVPEGIEPAIDDVTTPENPRDDDTSDARTTLSDDGISVETSSTKPDVTVREDKADDDVDDVEVTTVVPLSTEVVTAEPTTTTSDGIDADTTPEKHHSSKNSEYTTRTPCLMALADRHSHLHVDVQSHHGHPPPPPVNTGHKQLSVSPHHGLPVGAPARLFPGLKDLLSPRRNTPKVSQNEPNGVRPNQDQILEALARMFHGTKDVLPLRPLIPKKASQHDTRSVSPHQKQSVEGPAQLLKDLLPPKPLIPKISSQLDPRFEYRLLDLIQVASRLERDFEDWNPSGINDGNPSGINDGNPLGTKGWNSGMLSV